MSQTEAGRQLQGHSVTTPLDGPRLTLRQVPELEKHVGELRAKDKQLADELARLHEASAHLREEVARGARTFFSFSPRALSFVRGEAPKLPRYSALTQRHMWNSV